MRKLPNNFQSYIFYALHLLLKFIQNNKYGKQKLQNVWLIIAAQKGNSLKQSLGMRMVTFAATRGSETLSMSFSRIWNIMILFQNVSN